MLLFTILHRSDVFAHGRPGEAFGGHSQILGAASRVRNRSYIRRLMREDTLNSDSSTANIHDGPAR